MSEKRKPKRIFQCRQCRGMGEITKKDGIPGEKEDCPTCHGTGQEIIYK